MQAKQSIYTTAEVARIIQVDRRTVVRWCQLEILTAHQLPGSQRWRIEHDNLAKFLYAQRMQSLIPKDRVK
jgi:excisionase family DNA binding protein